MKELLERTRKKFGKVPRSFGFTARIYNHISTPFLLKRLSTGLFDIIYKDKNVLYRNGRIVWGFIIQANDYLFKPGRGNYPAAAVFSTNSYFNDRLYLLSEIAEKLYSLKGKTDANIELTRFAEIITGERDVLYNLPIPESLTGGKVVYYTTIMVHRKHLPVNWLVSSWLPLLVHPTKTKAAIILPANYWEPDLKKFWAGDTLYKM